MLLLLDNSLSPPTSHPHITFVAIAREERRIEKMSIFI
jgi:hypothetical protein